MSKRLINFSAGPAALPVEALERARDELLDFQGTGVSVMEISHRSPEYDAVHNEAISLVRELLNVPEHFKVLFLQGGGNLQFSMLPMNLLHGGRKADYVVTGNWARRAHVEAMTVAGEAARVIASTEDTAFDRLPSPSGLEVNPDAEYVHFCSNNTVYGTQWHRFPETGGIPLACDMSSDMMWRPFDVGPFGFIYAGAQKNLGPSGLVLALIRDDVLDRCSEALPKMLQYRVHAEKNSLYNTPPSFSIYLLRNVLDTFRQRGGLAAIEQENLTKAERLYGCIDRHAGFYKGHVTDKAHRSVMNVTFNLPDAELDARFIAGAKELDMVGVKGYRKLGGIRISMYNASRLTHIETLVSFMDEFARTSG